MHLPNVANSVALDVESLGGPGGNVAVWIVLDGGDCGQSKPLGSLHSLGATKESTTCEGPRAQSSAVMSQSAAKPALSKTVSFEPASQTMAANLTKSEIEAADRQKHHTKTDVPPNQTKKIAAEPLKQVDVIDVDNHPLLANLKVDGKEVGAYMLCKFADDVLGHRARQIFREKAASIKGHNGIYYYLKDLMRRFSQEEGVADAAKKSGQKKPRTDDDVVLDEHQFRKLMASDPAFECLVAPEDTAVLFQRIVHSATKSTMTHIDFVEFCLLDRMQLQEIEIMMDLIDYDGDGIVKPADFEHFYKDVDRAQKLVELKDPDGIVDLKYSTNDHEAAELKRAGYILYPKNIYEGHGVLHFWYKRARRDTGQPAIEAIQYSATNMDTALVAQGFVCMNGNKPFAKKYVWLKHAQARTFQAQELGDIFITSASAHDQRCMGRYMNEAHDVVAFNPPVSPTAMSTATWSRVDELENQIRQTLRRRCPADADGVLNFLKLFESLDKKNRKLLSANKLKIGLVALGCKIDVRRVDVMAVKRVDFDAFVRFVEMTGTEIDSATEALQRSMTKGSSNYRSIFKSHNAAGDGILSRHDFLRMLAAAQILVAPDELLKIIHRFDVNQDNVVDYADFLKFVTGVCDIHSRQAARVAEAAAAFQGTTSTAGWVASFGGG
ncbi:hypothetical protein DYB32_001260 [Aphanomyces invadans]|uniref:EF-hand domain-containing protein n=1 Tax=Aphanomyces invadans TaxID=157072 RepID=A0A3R6YF53_9STRA|nr:hypothetical protein DYB32_001260 [Aphanomyces invadans]